MSIDQPGAETRGRNSDGDIRSCGVAGQMGELARTLQAEPDLAATLQAITGAAVMDIPGADYAAITLMSSRGIITTLACSDGLVDRVERLQEQTKQGPCLSTAREHRTFRSDDLRTETRWPLFARAAADLGVGSMLSFQLFVEAENLGALNLYARGAHAFDADDEDTGLLFASHAAVALAGAQHEQDWNRALEERDLIGQAKGILMERYKIDAVVAFSVLVRASNNSNRKLREIARAVAETGQTPDRWV